MAILLDDRARAAIERRRRHGLDDAAYLRVEALRCFQGPLGWHWDVVIDWTSGERCPAGASAVDVDGATIYVDERVGRYAYWRDITLSGWYFGPIDRLTVDPALVLEIEAWEHAHPVSRPAG